MGLFDSTVTTQFVGEGAGCVGWGLTADAAAVIVKLGVVETADAISASTSLNVVLPDLIYIKSGHT